MQGFINVKFIELFFILILWYALDFQYFSTLYIIFQNFTFGVNYFNFCYKLFLSPYVVDLLFWHWQVRASSYNSNKLTNPMQQFYKFITWRFVSINMFKAPLRPSSGAYNCINSLWFYRWNVVVAVLLVVVRPDHYQQRCYHHAPKVKSEAANADVSSWWWT
jgi:hypothetical protein